MENLPEDIYNMEQLYLWSTILVGKHVRNKSIPDLEQIYMNKVLLNINITFCFKNHIHVQLIFSFLNVHSHCNINNIIIHFPYYYSMVFTECFQ